MKNLLLSFGLALLQASAWGDLQNNCKLAFAVFAAGRLDSPVTLTPRAPTRTARALGAQGELNASLDATLNVPKDPHAIDAIASYFSGGTSRSKAELVTLLTDAAARGEPLSLKTLLPDYVADSLGTTCAGPNCFNAVLNFEKSRQGLRVKNVTTGDAELIDWLKRGHKPVPIDAPLRPGDVVLLWHRAMGKEDAGDSWEHNLSAEVAKEWFARDVFLDHAAVYVGDGLFFHKGAKGSQFPWVFVDAKSLNADYPGGLMTVHRPPPK